MAAHPLPCMAGPRRSQPSLPEEHLHSGGGGLALRPRLPQKVAGRKIWDGVPFFL